jgi:hypothetical protein
MTKPAIHIMGDDQEDGVRLTIIRETRPIWKSLMTFGVDPHFDISFDVLSDQDDDTAPDGIGRPTCVAKFGGLDDMEKDPTDEPMARVFRSFGEDELRWLAKAALAAAGECRRIENQRRKKKARSGERGG